MHGTSARTRRGIQLAAALLIGVPALTAGATAPPASAPGGSAPEPATCPHQGGTARFALDNDGTGFDTTGAIAPGSIRLITAMNDSLVAAIPGGGWKPLLAESITANPDATVWTITMRPGITFHDGAPVDGAAVAANLEAFRTGKVTAYAFTAVDHITATGPLTAEVHMNRPWGAFPYSLIGQAGWMVSPSTIGTNDRFVGVGPFMLESWTPGDSARLVRNPHYWRAGLPCLDAVEIKFIPDSTVRRQAFDAGDIDGFINPSVEDIVDLKGSPAAQVITGDGAAANEYLLLLNTTKAPLDDVNVRRALAMAIDRDLFIKNQEAGLTTKASSFIDLNSPFAVPTDYPDYDPAAAKQLIAAYVAAHGPINLEIKLEPNPSVRANVDLIASFWNDAGVDTTITEIGVGQSAITAISDNYQVFSWFQFSSIDPDGEYPFFHSGGGTNVLNWTNFVDPKIDEGFDLGRTSQDPAERTKGYTMVQQELASQVPILWIDHLNGVEAAVANPKLHGIGGIKALPDGSPALGMVSGSFFSWAGVWLDG